MNHQSWKMSSPGLCVQRISKLNKFFLLFCFRYLFALQIKKDLATGLLACNDVVASILASYIIQAETGDYSEEQVKSKYVSAFKLIPHQDEEFELKVIENHKKLM